MKLNRILEKQKSSILDKWFDMVIATYPVDTSRFLKNQKDPFANPVGSATVNGLESVFNELAGKMDSDTIESCLDPIIRIRTVQDFTPSKAVGFIFFLKQIVRDSLHRVNPEGGYENELLDLESKIDEIGLIGFDIYMKCKEKIYQIKANDERNRMYNVINRAGLLADVTQEG